LWRKRAEGLYINLYSPTSGSKERNIQTYKYGEKATKEKKTKKKTASKCRLVGRW